MRALPCTKLPITPPNTKYTPANTTYTLEIPNTLPYLLNTKPQIQYGFKTLTHHMIVKNVLGVG